MESHNSENKSKIRNFTLSFITIAISVVFVLCAAEVVLRTFPSLISVPVLERFNSRLRQTVADRLHLSTKSSRRIIPSAERKDHGPDFYNYEPGLTLNVPVDPVDAALGAIEDVKLDRNGFCNPAAAAVRTTVDVILLGDSMTFCTAVKPDDTSSGQLESASGLRAYNLGIPGIGPFEYVELLRKFGLNRKPKFVVMNIYEGNDLRDSDRYHNFVLHGKQSMDQEAFGGPFAWSYSIAFIKAAIELELRQVDRNTGMDFRYTVNLPTGSVPMNVANNDRDEARYALRLKKGDISPEIMRPALDTFRELARQHGFVPVVTLIPSAYTAYAQNIAFNEPSLEEAVRAGGEVQRQWFRTYAAQQGIIFHDLTAAFQGAAKTGPLTYFPANVHLTPAGQRVVATAIVTALSMQSLPKPE